MTFEIFGQETFDTFSQFPSTNRAKGKAMTIRASAPLFAATLLLAALRPASGLGPIPVDLTPDNAEEHGFKILALSTPNKATSGSGSVVTGYSYEILIRSERRDLNTWYPRLVVKDEDKYYLNASLAKWDAKKGSFMVRLLLSLEWRNLAYIHMDIAGVTAHTYVCKVEDFAQDKVSFFRERQERQRSSE